MSVPIDGEQDDQKNESSDEEDAKGQRYEILLPTSTGMLRAGDSLGSPPGSRKMPRGELSRWPGLHHRLGPLRTLHLKPCRLTAPVDWYSR